MMKRRMILGALAALPVVRGFAETSRPLVLGQSVALSGPLAPLGLHLEQGARLWFDQVNASGGVRGQRIELRSVDDGYDPLRCKENTDKFLAADVFALFGYMGTPTSLAALPRVREAGIPFFAPYTGAMALRDPLARNVFHVRASYDDETALIVRQLSNVGLKRVAVLHQSDSYGQAGLDGVVKALREQGLKPIEVASVACHSLAVGDAVAQIVAARPDAVVQIIAYKTAAAFIRAARRAGYGGEFYNVSFVGTQSLSDELGKEARGIVVSQVMPYPFSPMVGIVREYLEAVKSAGVSMQPNYSGLEGYVDARVFVEGLQRGRRNTSEGLIAGLESLRDIDFKGFKLSFDTNRHTASRFVELSMLTGDGRVKR